MAEESTGHKRLGDTHGKAQAGREAAKEKTFKESLFCTFSLHLQQLIWFSKTEGPVTGYHWPVWE